MNDADTIPSMSRGPPWTPPTSSQQHQQQQQQQHQQHRQQQPRRQQQGRNESMRPTAVHLEETKIKPVRLKANPSKANHRLTNPMAAVYGAVVSTIVPSRRRGFVPSFTEFYRALPSFIVLHLVLPSLTSFYLVLLGFTEFLCAVPSFTGFYRVSVY